MDIAIDLGSDRTRVFIDGKGKVLDEASVITYDVDTQDVYAVGDEARAMIGKTPVGISAVRPLENGVIAHQELCEHMVNILVSEVCAVKVVMPRVVASVACDLTEVEKRAVVNAVSAFGARRVYLLEAPKAAALGCGLDISTPHGVFIADLGSGTADIGVVSLGGISVSKTVRKAGAAMDEEIVKYIRREYSLIIGTNMAESCKRAVGCLKPPAEPKTFRVKGRDAVSGMPRYVDVTGAELIPVLEEVASGIVAAIRDVLEKTPPELIGDIYSDGIFLTGGLAKLGGFARVISEATRLRVRVHKNAADCNIIGCGKAIKYINASPNPSSGVSPIIEQF